MKNWLTTNEANKPDLEIKKQKKVVTIYEVMKQKGWTVAGDNPKYIDGKSSPKAYGLRQARKTASALNYMFNKDLDKFKEFIMRYEILKHSKFNDYKNFVTKHYIELTREDAKKFVIFLYEYTEWQKKMGEVISEELDKQKAKEVINKEKEKKKKKAHRLAKREAKKKADRRLTAKVNKELAKAKLKFSPDIENRAEVVSQLRKDIRTRLEAERDLKEAEKQKYDDFNSEKEKSKTEKELERTITFMDKFFVCANSMNVIALKAFYTYNVASTSGVIVNGEIKDGVVPINIFTNLLIPRNLAPEQKPFFTMKKLRLLFNEKFASRFEKGFEKSSKFRAYKLFPAS